MNKKNKTKAMLVVSLVLLVSAMTAMADDTEVYTAFAVNMSGAGRSGATTFTMTITRWSTDEERTMLFNTLMKKGHDDFVKALRDQEETGFARGHGALAAANPFPSTRIHYAYQSVQDGTRTITLVTNRPIGSREAMSMSRSLDYDVTVVTMEFPVADGEKAKGTGSLHRALKVAPNKKTGHLDVEEIGNEAVRLTTIMRDK